MLDHLTPADSSYLYLEEPTTAMNAGSVLIVEPPAAGFGVQDLLPLVAARIAEAPRYRQRVREVPMRLSSPVWIDDASFDINYHVRPVLLPPPGDLSQLADFAARTVNRPLDRSHPLWEIYLVQGLPEGRLAIVTKTHQALVDGVHSIDIAHLLLDSVPTQARPPAPLRVRSEPSDLALFAAASAELFVGPRTLTQAITGGLKGVGALTMRVGARLGGLASAVATTTANPAPISPLNAKVGGSRRIAFGHTPLSPYRAIRDAVGQGPLAIRVTINDVLLTVVAGAMRAWLLNRGEPVHAGSRVRALVPISVGGDTHAATAGMTQGLIATVVDLPVGEPAPMARLRRISYDMRRQISGGGALPAQALRELAGFAPPTLHHLGIRVAGAMSHRMFNLVISNAPGPQHRLYVGQAAMLATYPVTPLAAGQALSVGFTSYDGQVYFGLNGERTVMTDIERLAQFLPEALVELGAEACSE